METPSVDAPVLPSQKILRGGVQAFILFSAIGTLLAMWWKRPAGFEAILSELRWSFVLLLVPMVWLDYWLGGLRYRLFFNGKQLPYISQWDCMRSNWANMFMGAATPFQTGGAPAQLYILWRKGASVSDGLLVSTVNYVATLAFFLLSNVAALIFLPENIFGENFTPVFRSGFGLITGVITFVLIVLFFPKTGLPLVRATLNILPLGAERRQRMLAKAETEVERFHTGFRSIIRENKIGLVFTTLATMLLYFNKFLIGYVLLLVLGQPVPFGVFIGLQVIQTMLLYYAPTPGASGLAELSTVWLMGKLLPESFLLVYAVVLRFVTIILAAVIGGGVLIQEMRWSNKS